MVLRRLKLEIGLTLFALILLAFTTSAHAGDDDRHGGTPIDLTNTNTNTADATNELLNNIGGNSTRSLALAGGNLGDVDIDAGACLGSEQYSIFVLFARQSLKRDLLCIADTYDRRGAHDLAAQLRCRVPEIAALDYKALGTTCFAANKFHVEPPATTPPPLATSSPEPDPDDIEDDDEHHGDDELIHQTAQQLADLKVGLERERSARQAYARKAAEQAQADADYSRQVLQKLKTIDQPQEVSQ
jgi:hypothetical protein